MKLSVHIIASCTDRKRAEIPSELRLREIAAASAFVRAERWWTRLRSHSRDAIPAADLYGGDHWSIARTLPTVAEANGFAAHLWVASAGYGLVAADASVRPYSATFAAGQADSVFVSRGGASRRAEYIRHWWARLGAMPGPTRRAPRSVTELVNGSPTACLMVVGSPDYISAMSVDLERAVSSARHPDRIIIVSRSGGFTSAVLKNHLIPSNARLQHSVGGARTSLHVRVARKVLEEVPKHGFSASALRAYYQRLLSHCEDAPTYNRAPMTDEQVERFVRTEHRQTPGISCTRALRALRDRGHACEQARFKAIFHHAVNSHAS